MKQLLNTLFVTSEDIYLSLEGENVLANREGEVIARQIVKPSATQICG